MIGDSIQESPCDIYQKKGIKKNPFERVKIWSTQLAGTKWGIWLLFLCAFADASFLPLPATTFFLFILFLNKNYIFRYVLIVVLGTVSGAMAGYAIGNYAWLNGNGEFTAFGQFLFDNIPGFTESSYENTQFLFAKWNFWILCAAAATPVPYGILAVFSGAFKINILVFFIATLISQSIKFLVLALAAIKLEIQFKKLSAVSLKPVAIISSVLITVLTFLNNTFKNLL